MLSSAGYYKLIQKLSAFAAEKRNGRIAVILEGGYDLEAGASVGLAITQALLRENFIDELGPAPTPESSAWEKTISEIKDYWKT